MQQQSIGITSTKNPNFNAKILDNKSCKVRQTQVIPTTSAFDNPFASWSNVITAAFEAIRI